MAASNQELERRLNILAEEVNQLKNSNTQSSGELSSHSGLGYSASKVYGVQKGLSIGAYGEVIYTNKRSKREDGTKASHATNPKVDTLRAVIYLGYKFNPKWVFNSEIEIEHANEIFTEFAYMDYLHSEKLNFRAGLILNPVGLVNEFHEPTTFLSVNRPEIEQKIIPSTWRENGLGVYGTLGGFSYKAYLINGLKADGFSSDGVRGGRKKGSQAEAGDLAQVARIDYTGISNLVVGASGYYGRAGGTFASVDHSLWDLHADWTFKGLKMRALYVNSSVDAGDLSRELGLTGEDTVGEKLTGYYTEVAYNVLRNFSDSQLFPFIRYENYNTQDKVPTGFTKDLSKDRTNITYGLMLKPIERIAFKLDYVKGKNKAKTGNDSWNLGMAWHF
ncbi:MAG: porin [Halobacteriovoraceae bacterium]|nr:porin [Halobacteriovoraceae bacterium]